MHIPKFYIQPSGYLSEIEKNPFYINTLNFVWQGKSKSLFELTQHDFQQLQQGVIEIKDVLQDHSKAKTCEFSS
jgi:uncharacterized protein YukE